MKKTLIALSISAVAMASSINATELYNQDGTSLEMGGRAEARLSMQEGDVQDKSRIRLNFLGTQAINNNLYGVGFWEGEFTTNEQGGVDSDENEDSSNLNTRYAYAGLGGAWGEITYGKNEGALGAITDFTDIMAYHGNSAADKLAVSDRTDNMMAYKGQFENLNVKASYRFADRVEQNGEYSDNKQDGYSLSAIYVIEGSGLELGAGYADQYDANEYMLAASYTMSDLYFAGVFTDGKKMTDTFNNTVDYTGYELASAYTLGQTVFTTTYNNAETNNDTSANNFAVDASYYFKPNFRGYISYNFNLIDAGDKFGSTDTSKTVATKIDAEDELALGLRYDF